MTDDPWTVVLADAPPRRWRAVAEVAAATLPGVPVADVNLAVRNGHGLVGLPLDGATAGELAAALCGAGHQAWAVRRAELPHRPPIIRCLTIDGTGPEVIPGHPWSAIRMVHVARLTPAPFFVGTARRNPFATLETIAPALDGEVADAASILIGAGEAMSAQAAPSSSTPELVVELLSPGRPALHLPVDSFDHRCLPAGERSPGGRRLRLQGLMEAIIRRAGRAELLGAASRARDGQPLDDLAPVEVHQHRQLVTAWLTRLRFEAPVASRP